ncbi:unnamed protein product, partial [Didymodactylos carnosus]
LQTSTDPLERLRAACLARGAQGIKGLSILFKIIDDDGNKKLSMDEFKKGVNEFGLHLTTIAKAFAKLDRNGDGQITVDDLRGVYTVKSHPKYMNGEWSEDQVLRQFLDCFDYGIHKDGI